MDKMKHRRSFQLDKQTYHYYDIKSLEAEGDYQIDRLPYSIRVLLEGALRQYDNKLVNEKHIYHLANWVEENGAEIEVPFIPSRIILQDFTGVPAVVDLAVMRDAVAKAGLDPSLINPKVPVDLVIDHSVMVDYAGRADALELNVQREFDRNNERYEFLKWAQNAFDNFKAVPPSTGIIHQVNLEYLATVATTAEVEGQQYVYPDSLVGTDSHTTMINGLGVLGWGVGGIEAEAGMLGQPLYFIMPQVVGMKLTGKLKEGVNATDLALTVTELLRKHHVVGQFVEYFGDGLKGLTLQDRATVANMSPEYGATMGFFPVDEVTLAYLETTGRSKEQVALTKAYYEANHLLRKDQDKIPTYSRIIELDLSTVKASLAGPKRPQDRIDLESMKASFEMAAGKAISQGGFASGDLGPVDSLGHGSVVLAAITSCTNTSNPSVMIGAGLVAKKAVELGLKVPDYVKTSLTPGSKVVTEYLKEAGVLSSLESLGFYVAGYGCATCIGNSGPLDESVEEAIKDNHLTVASVLSGNRNFEGRIHASIKANYLASPMLVVAYALAGSVRKDLLKDPIGIGRDGNPVYLKDIWPSSSEIEAAVIKANQPRFYLDTYQSVYDVKGPWESISTTDQKQYLWNEASTYIQAPPFFEDLKEREVNIQDIQGAKILALLKDSVTTDHISPAGVIGRNSPAGLYLKAHHVNASEFNSYGSRRGNHHVMMRGTFANIRIRNLMADGMEGGYTKHVDTGEIMPIYDAAMLYQKEKTPLVIIAGKEYGTGSSRDWAAKGTSLLGVKAVIAESYERIHRSNLVGMGVLPLQFQAGESLETWGLTGNEIISIRGLSMAIQPGDLVDISVIEKDGRESTYQVICRLDSQMDVTYYSNQGILHTVLRDMISN